jgi:hypothetical protein
MISSGAVFLEQNFSKPERLHNVFDELLHNVCGYVIFYMNSENNVKPIINTSKLMAKQETNFLAINIYNKDERMWHHTRFLLFSAMATQDYRSRKYQTIVLALAQWQNTGARSFMHDTLRCILYSLLAISGETRESKRSLHYTGISQVIPI